MGLNRLILQSCIIEVSSTIHVPWMCTSGYRCHRSVRSWLWLMYCVGRIAENGSLFEISVEWKKIWPADMVQQTMQDDLSWSRMTRAAAAKRWVSDEEETRSCNFKNLPKQSHLIHSSSSNTATHWFSPFQNPDELFKCILNTTHDMLPHNANLHLWGKKASEACPLHYADHQNLIHIISVR